MSDANLPSGHGWQVVKVAAGMYLYPRGNLDTRAAEKACALAAIAGDADAITAIMLCEHDTMFQLMVRKMSRE